MNIRDDIQDIGESKTTEKSADQEQSFTVRQMIRLITLGLSISFALYLIARWRRKLLEQRNRLAGDSTTDAPPPKKKKKER
jgi:hypothetical protein